MGIAEPDELGVTLVNIMEKLNPTLSIMGILLTKVDRRL